MKYLIVSSLLMAALGCSESKFTPGDGSRSFDKTPKTAPPTQSPGSGDGVGMTPGDEEPRPIEFDSEFDTFLRSCIAEEMTANYNGPVIPLKLTQTLDDFGSSALQNYEEFETLADLILRQIIDAEGLIDYEILRNDLSAQWQVLVDAMTNSNFVLPPLGTEEKAAMAFWTNIYNLAMIDILVKAPQAENVSSDIGLELFDVKRDLAGTSISLNEIEKGVMSLAGSPKDVPANIKIPTVEPRLHYTVVCGAVSCPRIRNFLYRPEMFPKVLIENELSVINSTKHFWMEDGEFLIHNQLFSFYPNDFALLYGNKFINLPEKLIPNCRDDIALIETAVNRANPSDYIYDELYDWTVNSQN